MKSWICFTGLLLVLFSGLLNSQTIIAPNYALKSHETLEIMKIETDSDATVFFMSIENRIEGGTFCADKDITIIYPDGTRSKITSSSGIPVCPAVHKFKSIGEKLDFTLSVPPLREGSEWIDLTENCSDNCFSFYGITLDPELNRKIDEAFEKADNSPTEAMTAFINILEETDKNDAGCEGLLYINIINLVKKTGDLSGAEKWYERFKLSGAPRLSQYLKFLNDQGIRY
jgi:hypothetical protein